MTSAPSPTRGYILATVSALAALAACSGGSSSSGSGSGSSTGTGAAAAVANTAPVVVNFGALGPSGGYVNGIFTSVIVCAPGSATNCQTIPNVLVDTGSVGLRVLSSALTLTLPTVQDSSGNVLQECIQFADFSYVWGPVALANVEIPGTGEVAAAVPGGSGATGIPIHLIAANPAFPVPASCLATNAPRGTVVVDDNTLENLGANGILGVGTYAQDCGSFCASQSADEYFTCPGGACNSVLAPLASQVWNPVAAFSSGDTNGVVVVLPAVGSGGAATVTGSLLFGIATQADNRTGSAQVYEIDQYGYFPQVVYNGTAYTSPNNGSFIDSGSEAYFFSDANSLASTGIVECGAEAFGYYCPATAVPFTLTVYGANSVNGAVSFSVANALNLFHTGFAAFSNLGGDSGTGPSSDYVDLGLPFFFGRSVFVGIAGTNSTYPNGFWAF